MNEQVGEHGYVRLVDRMGDELSIVNAARVSFDKESNELTDSDARLLKFLMRNEHWSPFRSVVFTFEVYAPLFVARQWWKHVVASSHVDEQVQWNESSRRYVTEQPVFYRPKWREQSQDKKQGSHEGLAEDKQYWADWHYESLLERNLALYNQMVAEGIAVEQARMVLPQSVYVRWRWTVSLQALLNFVQLRDHSDAQAEIQLYARVFKQYLIKEFPNVMEAYGA